LGENPQHGFQSKRFLEQNIETGDLWGTGEGLQQTWSFRNHKMRITPE
jgi:hypothetical protein